jgi:hypothetical protein
MDGAASQAGNAATIGAIGGTIASSAGGGGATAIVIVTETATMIEMQPREVATRSLVS